MLTHSIVLAMVIQFSAIDGQVRDSQTRAAIPFAKVELSRAQVPIDQQYTDSDGRFRFVPIDPVRYTISVDYSGYDSAAIEFDASVTPSPISIELTRMKNRSTGMPPVVSLRHLIPERARKEFDRARAEVSREDCAKAVGHFESGLRAFAQDASALNDLGNCYRKLGRLDRAEDSFKRAGALSNSVYIGLNLAEVYTAQERFKDAERVLLDAISKQPDAGDAYYGLALVYCAEGHFEEAEAAARQADSRPHRIADVHLLLSDLYRRRQSPAEAIEQLESFLKEAPSGPQSEHVRKVLENFRPNR
jgi:tetratricopeptide (TPR) repeat protein